MADEKNPIHKTDQSSTPQFTPLSRSGQLQSSSQPQTFQSSQLDETLLNDTV